MTLLISSAGYRLNNRDIQISLPECFAEDSDFQLVVKIWSCFIKLRWSISSLLSIVADVADLGTRGVHPKTEDSFATFSRGDGLKLSGPLRNLSNCHIFTFTLSLRIYYPTTIQLSGVFTTETFNTNHLDLPILSTMSYRRSRSEKGKWVLDPNRPVRRPPVKIPATNNKALIEENKLTLIGRITNPKFQKTRALVD